MSSVEGLENSHGLAPVWDRNEIPASFLSSSDVFPDIFPAYLLSWRCLGSTVSLVQCLEKLARAAVQRMDLLAWPLATVCRQEIGPYKIFHVLVVPLQPCFLAMGSWASAVLSEPPHPPNGHGLVSSLWQQFGRGRRVALQALIP